MKIYLADKTAMTILQFAVLLISAAIVIASIKFIPIHILMLVVSILFSVIGVLVSFLYLPLWFSGLQYSVGDGLITMKSGVFFRVEQTIKFSSVQYSIIATSPFSKLTGLNFVVLNVYGGKMLLMFLKYNDAKEIMKCMSNDYC